MEEHPHVTLYREIHESLQAGDVTALFDHLGDDVVWHQIGEETLRGKDAVIAAMSMMEEFEPDMFKLDVHDVVGNDEHVVGLVEVSIQMGDEPFSYRTAEIAHIEDGKVTERWAFSDDTQRIAGFFSALGQ